MTVQVTTVQKKPDMLQDMAIELGKQYVSGKLTGAGEKAKKTEAPKIEEPTAAGGEKVSDTPVDRRMRRSYTA